jgi:hypothetical protein
LVWRDNRRLPWAKVLKNRTVPAKKKAQPNGWAFLGSGGRDRTYDQLINSQLLYR